MADSKSGEFDVLNWAQGILHREEYNHLIKELENPLAVSIRANLLKVQPEAAIRKWEDWYGWKTEQIPFCTAGFWLKDYSESPGSTMTHRMGYYYLQEAASMLPVELFEFKNTDQPLILDMAASPGGKTTHIADRICDQGLIIANDASRSRIPALQIVLRKMGVINQAVTCLPGESYGNLYPDCFDAVLLDAPCSMQGLRSLERHGVRTVTEHELRGLADRQKRLLESALRTVKIGGQLVYATCSLTPHENEEVLDDVLTRFAGKIEIKDAHERIHNAGFGLVESSGRQLSHSVRNALRIWPHHFHTAGFFCAILEKNDHLPEKVSDIHRLKVTSSQKIQPVLPPVYRSIISRIIDQYGFDLEGIIEKQQLELCQVKDKFFLIPEGLLENTHHFPWISCGMLMGHTKSGNWEPSHEFVSRFGDQFQNSILILDDQFLIAWLRGEDIRGYENRDWSSGSVLIVRDQRKRNLGRARLLNDRLKNLLPTRLF